MVHRQAKPSLLDGLVLLSALLAGCSRAPVPVQPPQAHVPQAPRLLAAWTDAPVAVATNEPIEAAQTSALTAELPGYLEMPRSSPILGVRPIYEEPRLAARATLTPRPIPQPAPADAWSAPQPVAARAIPEIPTSAVVSQKVNYYSPPQSSPGPAATPAARQRSTYMAAIIQQAETHNRQGFELANRGAFFSARAEFIQALRLVAQGSDAEGQTTEHSQALAAAMRALEEAEDLAPRGSRLDADVQLTTLVSAHRTPVLKGLPLADISPVVAAQRYYVFAEEQFAAAVGAEQVGSLALHSLGKIHGILAGQKTPAIFESEAKAAAFYQAALLADPGNYIAANDLAVLLAKGGSYGEARELLMQAVAMAPDASVWHNLSVVHAQLGETDLAERAHQNALSRSGGANPGNPQAMMAMQAVRWVNPATFAATSTPSPDLQPPPANKPAAPAASQQPAPPARPGMARWLRWSTR